MAKMTKGMLKGIVKECLVELLAEGLGESTITESRAPRQRQPARKKKQSIFDQMDRSFSKKAPAATSFEAAVSNAARTATDDPILRELLADTAKTTLQEQLRHEPSSMQQPGLPNSGGGVLIDNDAPVTSAAAGLDINSLFGEATSSWSEVLERSNAKKLP